MHCQPATLFKRVCLAACLSHLAFSAAGQTIESDLLALTPTSGRAPGSVGHASTAEFIAQRFTALGLAPGATDEQGQPSYQQQLESEANTAVEFAEIRYLPEGDGEAIVIPASQIEPHWATGAGEAAGPGVFTGYSIVSGPSGYMSFTTTNDFEQAVALSLSLEPMDASGESLWTDAGGWSFRSSPVQKATALARRNASAVVFITPANAQDPGSADQPPSPQSTFEFDIPVLTISAEDADRFLPLADPQGRSAAELASAANAAPVLDQLTGRFEVTVEMAASAQPIFNIVGVLPGKGDLAGETIVLSANYDGPADLLAANDNASGVAALLHAAELLTRAYSDELPHLAHARSIVFLATGVGAESAEGFSAYLDTTDKGSTENPNSPPEVAMALVLDTLGKSDRGQLTVAGVNSGEGLTEWLEPIFASSFFEIEASALRRSFGDQLMSPFNLGIPAMLFTTGFHRDDGTPTDTAASIDTETLTIASELISDIALEAALKPERFDTDRDAANIRGPDRPRRSVRLGLQPAFNDDEPGILIQRVFDETSAADAGLMQGDRITKWGDQAIAEMSDFMLQLSLAEPGQVVTFTIIRDGEEQAVELTLRAPGE